MGTTEYSPLTALLTVAPTLRLAGGQTLSVYVPARDSGYDATYYDIVFADVLYRYRERLGSRELAVLESELPRLRSLVGVVRPAACGAIGAFSETDRGVFELITLPEPTVERLEVGDPLLGPALRQIENFPPALIAVADKERARLFAFILDDIFELAAVKGAIVRHSRAGGTSSPSNQRKAENRARANLGIVAGEIARAMASGAYQLLYVSGPSEARSQLVAQLRQNHQTTVAGRLGASLDSTTLEADLRRELIALRRESTVRERLQAAAS